MLGKHKYGGKNDWGFINSHTHDNGKIIDENVINLNNE